MCVWLWTGRLSSRTNSFKRHLSVLSRFHFVFLISKSWTQRHWLKADVVWKIYCAYVIVKLSTKIVFEFYTRQDKVNYAVSEKENWVSVRQC